MQQKPLERFMFHARLELEMINYRRKPIKTEQHKVTQPRYCHLNITARQLAQHVEQVNPNGNRETVVT